MVFKGDRENTMARYLRNAKIKKVILMSTMALFLGGQSVCLAHLPSLPNASLVHFIDPSSKITQATFFFGGLIAKFTLDYLASQLVSGAISLSTDTQEEKALVENSAQVPSNSTAVEPSAFGKATQASSIRATSVVLVESSKKILTSMLLAAGFSSERMSPILTAFAAGTALPFLTTTLTLGYQSVATMLNSVYNDDSSMVLHRLTIQGLMIPVGAAFGIVSYGIGSKLAKALMGDAEILQKGLERYLELMIAEALLEGLFIALATLHSDDAVQENAKVLVPCEDLKVKGIYKSGTNDSFDTHQWCENVDPFLEHLRNEHMSYNNMTLSLPKKDLEGTITAARLGMNYYKGVFPRHVELMRNLGLMNYLRNIQQARRALP